MNDDELFKYLVATDELDDFLGYKSKKIDESNDEDNFDLTNFDDDDEEDEDTNIEDIEIGEDDD